MQRCVNVILAFWVEGSTSAIWFTGRQSIWNFLNVLLAPPIKMAEVPCNNAISGIANSNINAISENLDPLQKRSSKKGKAKNGMTDFGNNSSINISINSSKNSGLNSIAKLDIIQDSKPQSILLIDGTETLKVIISLLSILNLATCMSSLVADELNTEYILQFKLASYSDQKRIIWKF